MGTRASSEIDRVIRDLAKTQLGLISVAQAARVGIFPQLLAQRRKFGMLIEVFPSVMRLAGVPIPVFQRALAGALAVPHGRLFGPTAGLIYGFPVGLAFAESQAPVTMMVPTGNAVRIDGITAIRQRIAPPTRPWFTTRVATPAATLVALPRFVSPAVVERCLDHGLVHKLFTVELVREEIESYHYKSVTGRRLLMELLDDRSDGAGHRSRLEQRVATWLKDARVGGWRRNHKVVVGTAEIEVDFAWPHRRVALEVSPFFTHGSRQKQERDIVRRRALVRSGWSVIEATDPDLENSESFSRVLVALRPLLV